MKHIACLNLSQISKKPSLIKPPIIFIGRLKSHCEGTQQSEIFQCAQYVTLPKLHLLTCPTIDNKNRISAESSDPKFSITLWSYVIEGVEMMMK